MATATARKAAAPRRRAARPARATATPLPGRMVPLAVGRTAGAVGDLADSGVVVRLTRGRLWIGVLATLLVGIVALNVIALELSARSSQAGRQADELKRQNSALRAELATELSSPRLQGAALAQGLFLPEPGAVRYRRAAAADAVEAAKRLRAGELTGTGYVAATPAPVAPVEEVVAETPTEAAPATAPPAAEPAVVDPGAIAAAPVDPAAATPTAAPPASGGAVVAP